MSDENTYNTDGDVDTSDDNSFDEQYVSREEFEKVAKKAEDQEKARKAREREIAELKAKADAGTGKGEDEDGEQQTPTESQGNDNQSTGDSNSDELSFEEKLWLKTEQITDAKELEVVKKAKMTGMTIEEALADDFVMGRINSIRQEKKVAEATDLSGGGGSESVSNEDSIIREFKKTGKIPDKDNAANIISAAAKKDKEVYNKLVTG